MEPSLLSTLLTQLIVGPTERLREALSSFRYLGPLREPPPRNYEPPRSKDESRWVTGLAAWDLLFTRGRQYTQQVSDWLSGGQAQLWIFTGVVSITRNFRWTVWPTGY